MTASNIEWTQHVWNPLAGCSVYSPGCTNCYAMKMAYRLEAMATKPDGQGNPALAHYRGTTTKAHGNKAVWTGRVNLSEHALLAPLRRRKPTTWFVNSMSDLFHEAVSDETIDRIFAVMALSPQHTFQLLTKRSDRMRAYFAGLDEDDIGRRSSRITQATNFVMLASGRSWGKLGSTSTYITTTIHQTGAREPMMIRGTGDGGVERLIGWREGERWVRCSDAYAERVPDWVKTAPDGGWAFKEWPLPNVWLGVSVEDQTRANQRIPDLLATPAAVRWISAEPLLGPVDLTSIEFQNDRGASECWDALDLYRFDDDPIAPGGNSATLDWVVTGGESGTGHRDNNFEANARSLRDQCAAAGVAFFGKQNVAKRPLPEDLLVRQFPAQGLTA